MKISAISEAFKLPLGKIMAVAPADLMALIAAMWYLIRSSFVRTIHPRFPTALSQISS